MEKISKITLIIGLSVTLFGILGMLTGIMFPVIKSISAITFVMGVIFIVTARVFGEASLY